MRCLQLSSLNRPRLALLLRHYLASQARARPVPPRRAT